MQKCFNKLWRGDDILVSCNHSTDEHLFTHLVCHPHHIGVSEVCFWSVGDKVIQDTFKACEVIHTRASTHYTLVHHREQLPTFLGNWFGHKDNVLKDLNCFVHVLKAIGLEEDRFHEAHNVRQHCSKGLLVVLRRYHNVIDCGHGLVCTKTQCLERFQLILVIEVNVIMLLMRFDVKCCGKELTYQGSNELVQHRCEFRGEVFR
mmetsp:Transcript_81962/g.95758  ORF Transcript_81962/g.95758 Transcript_81962/m.95758 type:complete len:204 (-) Transcript_81962:895-1506(-)